MALYTEKLTATIKYLYEETDRTIDAIAAEFDVCSRNIQRMAATGNWNRRRDRKRKPRDVPAANLLLEQAMGLEAAQPLPVLTRHPEVRAQRATASRLRPTCAPEIQSRVDPRLVDDGPPDTADYGPSPSRLGAARLAPQDDGDGSAVAASEPRLTPLSAVDRLEALVLKQIEAEEQGGTARPGRRQAAGAADRRARTLSTLTQTLQALQRMRAGKNPEHEIANDNYDDMPRDIDEFRRDLARRINAFVDSRTGGNDAGRDANAAPLDDAK